MALPAPLPTDGSETSSQLQGARDAASRLERERDALQLELAEARQQRELLRARVAEYSESASWQMTAPLRRAGWWVRRLSGRQ